MSRKLKISRIRFGNTRILRTGGLIALSMSMLVLFGGAPIARADSGSPECASNGNGLCLQKSGNGLGIEVTMQNENSGDSQNITRPLLGECDAQGTVTSTCPFTDGSGDNSLYEGDNVVNLEFPGAGLCVGAKGSIGPDNEGFVTILQNCSGSSAYGTIWVAVPNGSGLKFINVRATDDDWGGDYPYPIYELWSDGNINDPGIAELAQAPGQGTSSWAHP